jgi:SAM-dependent methyltransferase
VSNVEFIQGGFLTYHHKGAPLDAVVTQIALHHLPDFWKQIALMRMSGMLKDGGKFCLRDVVYSFDIQKHESFFEGFISKASEAAGPKFAENIEAHIKNEYSTLDWIMKGMIERAGSGGTGRVSGWFCSAYFAEDGNCNSESKICDSVENQSIEQNRAGPYRLRGSSSSIAGG